MPRAIDHRLPQHPRDAVAYYALGLTAAQLDRRHAPGADIPVPRDAERRSRVLALLARAGKLVAGPRRRAEREPGAANAKAPR